MKGAIMKRGWVFVVIGCLALFLPTNLQAESPSLEPQTRQTVQLGPRIPEQSTPFNFVMESGPGVQYFTTERVALTLGVRFHHISNAGLGDRNKGLNSTLGYLGLSVFFPR